MSTTALVGALLSGLVWLGVLALVALGWVDDRRRDDDGVFDNPRPLARVRVAEREDAPRRVAPDAPTVTTPAPPEPAVATPAPSVPAVVTPAPSVPTVSPPPPPASPPPAPPAPPKSEPSAPAKPRERESESGGSWQIHPLHNGEGSRTPPNAPRPDAAGDGS